MRELGKGGAEFKDDRPRLDAKSGRPGFTKYILPATTVLAAELLAACSNPENSQVPIDMFTYGVDNPAAQREEITNQTGAAVQELRNISDQSALEAFELLPDGSIGIDPDRTTLGPNFPISHVVQYESGEDYAGSIIVVKQGDEFVPIYSNPRTGAATGLNAAVTFSGNKGARFFSMAEAIATIESRPDITSVIWEGISRLTSAELAGMKAGNPNLYKAITEYFKARNGNEQTLEEAIAANGGELAFEVPVLSWDKENADVTTVIDPAGGSLRVVPTSDGADPVNPDLGGSKVLLNFVPTPGAAKPATATVPAVASPIATTVVVEPTQAIEATAAVKTDLPAETAEPTVVAETEDPLTFEQWATIDNVDPKLLEARKLEFSTVMGIPLEKITLEAQIVEGPEGSFAQITDKDTGTVLFLADSNPEAKFKWEAANPGSYWAVKGKILGAHIDGNEWSSNKSRVSTAVNTIVLRGQVRPGPDITERQPGNAAEYLRTANREGLTLVFHNIVEIGKYPETVTADTVDDWLTGRVKKIGDLLLTNKPKQPVLLVFNENTADSVKPNTREANPMEDKHGANWLGEALYIEISTLVNQGLVPNTDFLTLLNENLLLESDSSLDYVHTMFYGARQYAFDRLVSDPQMKAKIEQMGIKTAADLKIITGSETYINLDGQPHGRVVFSHNLTVEEMIAGADKFEDLGGLMFMEVGLFGTIDKKAEFLEKLRLAAFSNPNILGVTLWNTFHNPDDQNGDAYSEASTFLFDENGLPTTLFFQLLGSKDIFMN